MIFVILGIVILVISFVAALISLIREPKGGVAEESGSDKPQTLDKPQVNSDTSKRVEQIEQMTKSEPDASAYRFPWEEKSSRDVQIENLESTQISGEPNHMKLGGGFSVSELAKKKREGF